MNRLGKNETAAEYAENCGFTELASRAKRDANEEYERGRLGGKEAAIEYVENSGNYTLAQLMKRDLIEEPAKWKGSIEPCFIGVDVGQGDIGVIFDPKTQKIIGEI